MPGGLPAEIIHSTRVRCSRCGGEHPASLERAGWLIIGRVLCPQGEQTVQLSSDADLFLALRNKSRAVLPPSGRHKTLLNLLDITDKCDFRCPVCYADAGGGNNFLSPDKIYETAAGLRASGAKILTLSGGEPTEHPRLVEILQKLRPLGFYLIIATNGAKFARGTGFARLLKSMGLNKAAVQFDTFSEDVHEKLRGNRLAADKVKAVKNIAAAGLDVGLTVTATSLNISEAAAIVRFGLSLLPGVKTIVFQAAAPEGRFKLSSETLVDKEQIIKALIAGGLNICEEDFWPLPVFSPWGMELHPDCGVNAVLVSDGGEIFPLSRYVDIAKLHRLLAENKMSPGFFSKNAVPFWHLLQSARPGMRGKILQLLLSRLFRLKNGSAVVVGAGDFVKREFQDLERLALCSTAYYPLDGNGESRSPCEFK